MYSFSVCQNSPVSSAKGSLMCSVIVDGGTRMGGAVKIRSATSACVMQGLPKWKKYGDFSVLVTDSTP